MEVRTSTLRKVVLVLLLAGLLFAGWKAYDAGWLPFLAKPTPVTAETTPDSGENAAVTGITTLLSVDVTLGKDAWMQSFCDVATENGCAFAQLFYGGNWDKVVEQKVRSRYEVTEIKLYRDLGDGRQVWEITGTLHNLNDPSLDKSGTAHVLTVKENGVWKFDHLLFEDELKALDEVESGGQP